MADLRYRFPGTKPFTSADQDIFEGRKKSIHRLYDLLQAKNMIVFYAESGIGKSSLVNAGLVPLFRERLSKENYLPVKIRFLANEKKAAEKIIQDESLLLQKTIAQLAEAGSGLENTTLPFADPSQEDLWHMTKKFQRNNYKLLLIFDQAEELFTYSPKQIIFFKQQLYNILSNYLPSYLDRKIAQELAELNDESMSDVENAGTEKANDLNFIYQQLNTKILFVIREDKLGFFDSFSDFFPDILKNTCRLKPLEEAEARDAIKLPAGAEGDFLSPKFDFELNALDELISILLEDDATIDPYTIQLSCSYLERSIVLMKGKTLISKDDIPQKGVIENEYFTNVWAPIPDYLQQNIPQYKKLLAEKLIDPENKIRIKTYEGNFLNPEVLRILVQEGLIREDHNPGEGKYYELSHDRLVKPILEFYNQQKELDELKKANKLYEKLLKKATETYSLTDDQVKALHILVEEYLVVNLTRATVARQTAMDIPGMREDALRYLIDGGLLKSADDHLELSDDRYLTSIITSYQGRKRKEDIEQLAKSRKQRSKVITRVVAAVVLLFILYLWQEYNQKNMIDAMAMLNKAHTYADNGDLEKAYGIYHRIYKNNIKYFKSQIDNESAQINATDLPGDNITALSNNRIVCMLDSNKTIQVWKICSPDHIFHNATFKKNMYAISRDGRYLACDYKDTVCLYDSKTNHITKIQLYKPRGLYYAFSINSDYFSYNYGGVTRIFNLANLKSISCRLGPYFDKTLLTDVISVSDSVIYSAIEGYLIKWKKQKGVMNLDNTGNLISHSDSWCSVQKDTVMVIGKNGIKRIELNTNKQQLLLNADLSRFHDIKKITSTSFLLSTYQKNSYQYSAVAFFDATNNTLYEPLPGQTIDKFSLSKDYKKCILRSNGRIYLIDRIKRTITLLPFNEPVYDIADDGNYILHVKERITTFSTRAARQAGIGVAADTTSRLARDTVAHLYLLNLKNGKDVLVDTLAKDSTAKSGYSIYGIYFFRFNPPSDGFAYLKKAPKNSFKLVVKNIKDLKTIYRSAVPETFVDKARQKDFTSNYIHVKTADSVSTKEGIRLLNQQPRTTDYFLKLYKPISDEEWNKEVKNARL